MRALFHMMRWVVLTGALCVAISSAPAGHWWRTPVPSISTPSSSASPQLAIADLDGDHSPDFATIEVQRTGFQGNQYSIRVRLTSGSQKSFGVTAPTGGLQIVPRDVNGDSVPDLVVSAIGFRQPIAVLINDGHGNFTSVSPAAFPKLVWEASPEWGARPNSIHDHCVPILPRVSAGESEQGYGTFRPPQSAHLVSLAPCSVASLASFQPYLSRPPPFFALHS